MALLMEPIIVNRFKPYRKMRWCRSNYLWLETNPYLEKYALVMELLETVLLSKLKAPIILLMLRF